MSQTDWEAISAVSQMVGSVAVVFSVLYLAVQVHRSTRIAKVTAQDMAATSLRDVTKPFAENAELARIWRVGLESLPSLSEEEQARFFHSTYQFLKAFETIHFHHVHGLMDEQIWQGWCGLLEHYVAAPGIDHYWRLRHDLFSKRFQQFVQTLERPAERRTVANLPGQERP
ncbi:MAG TPA: hypothetical protein VFO30_07605 [Chthoniobacterales bacterium]|nr:hypothetical protein [Chthoniobacterales bacterium]